MNSTFRPLPLLLFAAWPFAATGLVAQDPPVERRFDDRVPADIDPARAAAWRRFAAQHAGPWGVRWSHATGTPKAIFGVGLPIDDWRENSMVEARRHAERLLRDQADLLGLGASDFREAIGARMGRTWSFVFDQYFHGLPVIGGRADVRVSMAGRIAMFGSAAFTVPAEFVTTPAVDADTATLAAWQALGPAAVHSPNAKAPKPPRLVIWGDAAAEQRASIHLAWEISVHDVGAAGVVVAGRSYVDATTAQVLQFVNDQHECGAACAHAAAARPVAPAETPVAAAAPMAAPATAPLAAPIATTVTIQAHAWTGLSPSLFATLVPLPRLDLTVPGIGPVTTDDLGRFTVNVNAPVAVTIGNLDGTHFQNILGPSAPSQTFTITPGVNQVVNLLLPVSPAPQLAHTTAALWVDRVNEWARTIFGNSPQLAITDNFQVEVNYNDVCNAAFNAQLDALRFFAAGGGCVNTAYSTVIAHEWGHGLDDVHGGISQVNGLSEGWGDIVAMYLVDDPQVGLGFSTSGVPVRSGLNLRAFPTGTEEHEMGETWMGFGWKVRDLLAQSMPRSSAIALSNDIVLGTIVANAGNQPDAVLEVFLADDDDGDLQNGTPHETALMFAAFQHLLPTPTLHGPINDYCSGALTVVDGINGPFTNNGSGGTFGGWMCGDAAHEKEVWFRYVCLGAGQVTVSTCGLTSLDTKMKVRRGSCSALPLMCQNSNAACGLQTSMTFAAVPDVYYIQVGADTFGSFSLSVQGPTPTQATSVVQGTGCGTASRAFYELFPSQQFDLAGQAMRLINRGTHYDVVPGGAMLPLTGNSFVTSHGDDTVLNLVLIAPMPFPGGSAQTLEVCSNGFVSAGTGNGASANPGVAAWLNSARTRWGTWHDFDPSAAGSGKIHYDFVGSIAYVTWDNVFTFSTTVPSRWQIQFDQITGDITMCWQTWPTVLGQTLVGATVAGANLDLGNRDVSATLPAGFHTHPYNAQPLALTGNLPRLGTTLQLSTSNFPSTSPAGLQLLGYGGFANGIDLTALGMPGCSLWTDFVVMDPLVPSAGHAQYTIPIPVAPSLVGAPLTAQSAALAPSYNALQFVVSNGVWMTIGS